MYLFIYHWYSTCVPTNCNRFHISESLILPSKAMFIGGSYLSLTLCATFFLTACYSAHVHATALSQPLMLSSAHTLAFITLHSL